MNSRKTRQRLLATTVAGMASFGLAAGGAVLISAATATVAVAQDLTQGALRGTVQNQAGDSLAGATVTVRSAAQGFSRSVTSGPDGQFRASALPPGAYDVTVSADGYETLTEQIRVGVGGTTDYVFTVRGGGVASADEIVVVGARSSVSVFDATTTGLAVDVEELSERAPIARSATAIALLAPGVTESDSAFGSIPTIGGSSAGENTYFVNGLNITKFRDYTGSSIIPFEFYKTIETKTGGYQAEFGRGTGGVLNATTKSGTNEWQFEVSGWLEPEALRNYSDNTYAALNQNDRRESSDVILEAGGPIIKDRLFVYGLYNARDREFFDQNTSGTALEVKSNDPFYGGKVDFLITPDHRVEGTIWTDKQVQTTRTIQNGADQGSSNFEFGGENWILRYTGSWTDWLTTSLAYGKNEYNEINSSPGDNCPVVQLLNADGVTVRYPGACYLIFQPQKNYDMREVLRADVDLFVDFFGEHRIRLGVDNEKLTASQILANSGSGFDYARPGSPNFGTSPYNSSGDLTGGIAYRYQTLFTSANIPAGRTDLIGKPRRVRITAYANNGAFESEQNAYYLQDSWEVTDRLTVNLGIRNESFQNAGVGGDVFVDQKNQWAPRLGFTYDVFGDRSAKLFGFFGKYFLPVAANTNQRLAGAEFFIRDVYNLDTTVKANDANGDGIHDTNLTPFLAGCQILTDGSCNFSDLADGTTNPTDTLVDANLEPMFVDEYILGYEQRLGDMFGGRFEGWTASAKATYRELGTAIDDVAIDAAVLAYCTRQNITGCDDVWSGFHQYVLTNPGKDMSIVLSADDLAATSAGPTARRITLSAADLKYPEPERTYKALELSLEKAFNGSWGGRFSYVWSENKGNYEGALKSDNGQSDPGLSQDFDQPGLTDYSYGYLPNHRAHTFKAFGSYSLTEDFLIGANVLVQSPRKFGCIGFHPTDAFAAAYEAASFYCNGKPAPRGESFESDWLTQIDVTFSYDVGKLFKLPGRGLTLRADVFNLLNSNAKLDFNEFGELTDVGDLDPNYGAVTRYQTPRYIRFGFNYKF